MTAVDIFKASRMKEIEDTTVVGGLVDSNGRLLLSTRAGEEIDAGNVVGPPGLQGPGFVYRGVWTATTAYSVRDVVTSNGSTFVVNTAHTSGTTAPTAETPGANLSLWARKGTDGVIGADGSSAVPAGTISLWGSDTAPANWLICDGSAVSRTAYPSLFATIGTKYGAGDGVNTFNLPNLKGRTPIGYDAAQTEFNLVGKTGGSKTHLLTALQSGLRAHNHTMPDHNHIEGFAGVNAGGAYGATTAPSGNVNSQSGQSTANHAITSTANPGVNTAPAADAAEAHNILQPYSVVNFIIKVTNGDTPGDSQLTQRVSNLETFASASPAGTITIFGGDTAPTNWRICDGAAISRTTYASLFAAIGTKYGAGDGSTTFNLPNFKGRAPFGLDSTQTEFNVLGKTGGTKTHRHSHAYPFGMSSSNMYGLSPNDASQDYFGAQTDFDHIKSSNLLAPGAGITSGGALEIHKVQGSIEGTLPSYLTVNYIIKITNGDTQGDSQLTQRVSAIEDGSAYSIRVREKGRLLQQVLTGGGARSVAAEGIKWGERFIVLGAGTDTFTKVGYFDIGMPGVGTVIPVYDHATITSVTIAAAGWIPLTGWSALYYDMPFEQANQTTDPSRFRIVQFGTDKGFRIPPNWLLICVRNDDVFSPMYTWGDGQMQDYWRQLTLGLSWVHYSGTDFNNANNYDTVAYRLTGDGEVVLRGLMAGGTGGAPFTLGGGFGPNQRAIFSVQANAGFARIDVLSNGEVHVMNYIAGGNNGYVTLNGVRWFHK